MIVIGNSFGYLAKKDNKKGMIFMKKLDLVKTIGMVGTVLGAASTVLVGWYQHKSIEKTIEEKVNESINKETGE